jgi:hypothetical protein
MKKYYITIILALTVMIAFALISSNTVVAGDKQYKSGFKRGVSDGKKDCGDKRCNWDILKPGNGFAHHSTDFNKGYVNGFCSVNSGGSDADEATFHCS